MIFRGKTVVNEENKYQCYKGKNNNIENHGQGMQVSTSFAVFKYQCYSANKDSNCSQKVYYQVELEKSLLNGEICNDVLKNQNTYNNKANNVCVFTPVKEISGSTIAKFRGIIKEEEYNQAQIIPILKSIDRMQ
ncbi:hypothetical protein TTHERM_000013409 (macronuclear) [Tetrahymena thermophila SB210]|uniref:Uncharacterized protein n=1 Tax=Tetrahymena thermophila (strain SB210) TaxID=312017 RepID=W7XKB1_TETTS|nr:hypothetical protein TTHERM_000013409 [Tetrahymena thermophila SB210]EWS76351.1 hypothetical protein TTHERM_000013409 [Tetrahymena thermophila SB210]|eukprot:XP_012651135.1 hypothetical protein TTHERM_000013409 [Tetrahymena thermophila SB210]